MERDDDRPAELFQLEPSTCSALLGIQHIGRLVIGGDDPAVVPVNYRAVPGAVTFRTTAGGRAAAAAGERVLFEVDMFDDRTHSGWSVIVHGRLGTPSADDEPGLVDTWAPGPRDVVMTVSVDTITGRLLRGAVEATNRRDGYL